MISNGYFGIVLSWKDGERRWNKNPGGAELKKIGIGYENYKEFIDGDMYYIDKTLLIQDIMEKGGKVTLFTRPRRFGKTLALSMLRTFFELEYDREGNVIDKSHYFEGKKIMDADEKILSKMGRYPVISLSLKSAKQDNYTAAFLKLRDEIIEEYRKHSYLWEKEVLPQKEREELQRLSEGTDQGMLGSEAKMNAEISRYSTSLKKLSLALQKYHDKNVIILLDEYDVPLENAYFHKFYEEMVGFIRSLFESCLKTNDALEFGVVTGCLSISKESIFTGLNHLKINSVRDNTFSEGFGFTPQETEKMLHDYGIADRTEEVREWYNGYLFGDKEIYNPWSVINYVDAIVNNGRKFPEPYWANTSSNQIIKEMVWQADSETKKELDLLIQGGTIEKQIHEDITYDDITYDDIHESEDNLWNFLFFTGYMKKVSERYEGKKVYLTMKIPNQEIASIYENQIMSWFDQVVKKTDRAELYRAILGGDTERIADYVSGLLEKSISTFDSGEAFYHGFFLSMLNEIPRYTARSNREEGMGRPDITLYPDRPKDPAILFEIKTRKKFNQMDDGLSEAYKQIRDQKYEEGILDDGYAGGISYGICFCKKSCIVGRLEKE